MFRTLGGQVAVEDPQAPSVQEFYAHPDYRVIAAFFLGWVFLISVYHIVCCALLRDVIRRLCLALRLSQPRMNTGDVEAPSSQEKAQDSRDSDQSSMTRWEINDSAFVFILNLCFAFTAVAEFASLLNLDSPNGDSVACAFVVAWGSMAAESARIFGLLMLSWRLRRLGIRFVESCVFWVGLLAVLGLVFALNATGPGTTSILAPNGISICYKQIYLPLSVALSGTLMGLELYTILRFVSLATYRPLGVRVVSKGFASLNVARAASLFALDLCTLVPGLWWVNTLAQNLPFCFSALLVIGTFNYPEKQERSATPRRQRSHDYNPRNSSALNMQRMSHNSLLTPSPFLLHFTDTPLASMPNETLRPSQHGRTGSGAGRDLVLHITRESTLNFPGNAQPSDIPAPPHSAPPKLTDPSEANESRSRKILPFQVEYARHLEEQAESLPTGPIVRKPKERPHMFVVIHDEDSEPTVEKHNSHGTIMGSDIIRLTPRTPRTKPSDSRLLSPDSAAPSCFPYSPVNDPVPIPCSAFYRSTSSSSAYTQNKYSMSGESSADEYAQSMVPPDSMRSPSDSPRRFSWRFLRQSYASTRTQAREELPTVLEGSSDSHSSLPRSSTGRSRSRRTTFGQSKQSVMSPDEPMPARVPSLSRLATIFKGDIPPSIPPLPFTPVLPASPLLVASPTGSGIGRGTGLLGGTSMVRGPRPPRSGSKSPGPDRELRSSLRADLVVGVSPISERSDNTGLASDGHSA